MKILDCKRCNQPFESHRGCLYCSDECRYTTKIIDCMTCGRPFKTQRGCLYCSPECRDIKAPAVYRFICPDGRSYVGAVRDIRWRGNNGIQRSNPRLLTAFQQYPPGNWTFEILEWLPAACSKWQLREAEQRYIDRLQSWSPESGFNILPAVWGIDGPAQRAARQWRAAATARHHGERRQVRTRACAGPIHGASTPPFMSE
jgi:hypothetical protein